MSRLFHNPAAVNSAVNQFSDANSRQQVLAGRILELGKRRESWADDDFRQWDDLNLKYDSISAQLDGRQNRLRRVGAETLDDAGPGGNDHLLNAALTGWAKNALGKRITPKDASACEEFGIALNSNTFNIPLPRHAPQTGRSRLAIQNALSTGQGSAGGFSVAEGFVPRLERALLSFAGVLQCAEVWSTETGANLPWPTCDDTNNIGQLLGENQDASADETDPQFGALIFSAWIYSSKLIRVSNALLEDSGVDLAGALGDMCGERIGRALSPHLTNGTGGTQPRGIVTDSTLGVSAASQTAIVGDDLINLLQSIDPAYLGEGCGWLMHNAIIGYLRQLKDGIGRYLWTDSLQAGQPPMLLGFPVTLCQAMDSTISAGKKTVAFGKLDKYKVRRVSGNSGDGGVKLMRLVERYAEFGQTGFLAFARFDGGLLDAGTHPVKYLQH